MAWTDVINTHNSEKDYYFLMILSVPITIDSYSMCHGFPVYDRLLHRTDTQCNTKDKN